jgi:hypothetical protein
MERVDERAEMRQSVQELVEHLNEHVGYYTDAVIWGRNRDDLLMMMDGFYVPNVPGNVSIASVVDREPIGIIGNCLIYRVGAASFIGYGKVTDPRKLYDVYADREPVSDPLLVSLPSNGVYAQTIMDECLALEEHQGSVDWVLNDVEPELGTIDPSLLTSRRVDTTFGTLPTNLPGTIINLQNTPDAPTPSGLQGVLNAVTNPNAFRDMAGLAGTQANAAAALSTAANLASNFGNQAAAIKLAEVAAKAQATQNANQQLATVQHAQNRGLLTKDEASAHANQILGQMHSSAIGTPPHQSGPVAEAIRQAAGQPGSTVKATTADGAVEVTTSSSNQDTQPKAAKSPDASPDVDERPPLIQTFGLGDRHGAFVARLDTFSTSTTSSPQLAFASDEHFDLGYRGVQPLIDAWARSGLIGGGAFVEDSDANGDPLYIDQWQIFTPDPRALTADITSPYGRMLSNGESFPPVGSRCHWQYIAPNPYTDASGASWTPSSLKAAIKSGKAVTLSIGDMLMLSGDLVEAFSQLSTADRPNWRTGPVNIMKGYDQLEPFAMTGLRLMQFPRSFALDDLRLLERNQSDYAALKAEVRQPHPYWDRTKAVVEYLKKIKGPTGCSELLVLSRAMRKETANIRLLVAIAPWLEDADGHRLNDVLSTSVTHDDNVGIADKDGLGFKAFSRGGGFDIQLFQLVVTNGHYGALALRNESHFAPGNWDAFQAAHQQALQTIDNALTNSVTNALGPIPAEAIAQTAFGLHFLTDAFATGHMRTPRSILGQQEALLSKVMHDVDNRIGLFVTNDFNVSWRAFGDGYLDNRDSFQAALLQRLPSTTMDISQDANSRHIVAAVVAAMKQLHYQAQSHLQRLEDENGLPDIVEVLRAHRGDASALNLDGYASAATPGDPGADRDAWLAMDIPSKLVFLRRHQPIPLTSGRSWLTDTNFNHPELVLADGAINDDFTWQQHITQAFKDFMLKAPDLGEILDMTELVQVAKNMPSGASSWYGAPEAGLKRLLQTLRQDLWTDVD